MRVIYSKRYGVTGMDDESQRSAKHSIATFFFSLSPLFKFRLNFARPFSSSRTVYAPAWNPRRVIRIGRIPERI